MAIATEIIYTIEDQAAKRSTFTAYAANGFTLPQYSEAIQALAVLVDAILTGVLVGADFCVVADLSGLTGNAVASTADVEDVGVFSYLTGDNRPVIVNVPCILDTLSVSGSDDLDEADADVAAFISMYEDGLVTTGGTIQPCDVDEDDVVSLAFAREAVRNSGSRS